MGNCPCTVNDQPTRNNKTNSPSHIFTSNGIEAEIKKREAEIKKREDQENEIKSKLKLLKKMYTRYGITDNKKEGNKDSINHINERYNKLSAEEKSAYLTMAGINTLIKNNMATRLYIRELGKNSGLYKDLPEYIKYIIDIEHHLFIVQNLSID